MRVVCAIGVVEWTQSVSEGVNCCCYKGEPRSPAILAGQLPTGVLLAIHFPIKIRANISGSTREIFPLSSPDPSLFYRSPPSLVSSPTAAAPYPRDGARLLLPPARRPPGSSLPRLPPPHELRATIRVASLLCAPSPRRRLPLAGSGEILPGHRSRPSLPKGQAGGGLPSSATASSLPRGPAGVPPPIPSAARRRYV